MADIIFMSVNKNFNIDPTECVEIMRSVRLVCTTGDNNKDYQAVFGVNPKTKEIVSWVEWGRINDVTDSQYKKKFKIHYMGKDIRNAIIPVRQMLLKKAQGKGASLYTLVNQQRAFTADCHISISQLDIAYTNWNKENKAGATPIKPRKRIRAGNVLIPFAQRTNMTGS